MIISSPKWGELGEVIKVVSCMYQVEFDNGSVSRVWKSNVRPLIDEDPSDQTEHRQLQQTSRLQMTYINNTRHESHSNNTLDPTDHNAL